MDSVDSEVFLEALEVEDVKILALYFEQAILCIAESSLESDGRVTAR